MDSLFSLARLCVLLLAMACISGAGALDIAFDRLQCDESLPVYATSGDIVMTCNDGSSNRCSFGQQANIRGTLQYHGMNETFDGLGYASANLRLLSVEYNLFNNFEIDMCGDWVQAYNKTDDDLTCPAVDGYYYFNINYELPYDDDDLTAWFASGFSGVSELTIATGTSDLLADCTIHWHTYVSASNAEGFKTMPSAAQTGIVLMSIFTAIICCCTYMICCRRRKKSIADISHYSDFAEYENYKAMKRGSKRKERRSKEGREAIDDIEASRLP